MGETPRRLQQDSPTPNSNFSIAGQKRKYFSRRKGEGGKKRGRLTTFYARPEKSLRKKKERGGGRRISANRRKLFGESLQPPSLRRVKGMTLTSTPSVHPFVFWPCQKLSSVGRSVGRRASSVGDYSPRRGWRCQGPASPGACGGPGGGTGLYLLGPILPRVAAPFGGVCGRPRFSTPSVARAGANRNSWLSLLRHIPSLINRNFHFLLPPSHALLLHRIVVVVVCSLWAEELRAK